MRILDLFSGIGGFSLASTWVWGDELEIAGFCEIDEYCRKVLRKNFPGVPIYEDIKKLNGEEFNNIDLITGGFPCTDISVAGKGKGLVDEETGERTRSGLWFEMHRIIGEVRPKFALIENVPMLTLRGGTRVIADLTQIGYDAEWQIVGADDGGAWHRRKRIWIVAYSQGRGTGGIHNQSEQKRPQNSDELLGERGGLSREVPDTVSNTKRTTYGKGIGEHQHIKQFQNISKGSKIRSNITDSRRFWAVEPDVGRVANGIPKRVDRLKGIGNAVVPQIPYIIGKRLKELCQRNQAEKH